MFKSFCLPNIVLYETSEPLSRNLTSLQLPDQEFSRQGKKPQPGTRRLPENTPAVLFSKEQPLGSFGLTAGAARL